MGANSSLGENSWVYALAPVSIGENSCIGKDVYLLTGSHNIDSLTFDLLTAPIVIGSGCWLATNVTVLPGINICDYSVVGASSLVAKDVQSYDVVGGNPAKFIKKRIMQKL